VIASESPKAAEFREVIEADSLRACTLWSPGRTHLVPFHPPKHACLPTPRATIDARSFRACTLRPPAQTRPWEAIEADSLRACALWSPAQNNRDVIEADSLSACALWSPALQVGSTIWLVGRQHCENYRGPDVTHTESAHRRQTRASLRTRNLAFLAARLYAGGTRSPRAIAEHDGPVRSSRGPSGTIGCFHAAPFQLQCAAICGRPIALNGRSPIWDSC
jgi:hypothetical protein